MTKKKDKNSDKIGRIADRPYWMMHFAIFARAIHQVGAAVFLGAYLLGDTIRVPSLYLIIAFVSGLLLLAVEGIRHRQFMRETFGLVTIFKMVIVGLAYHGWLSPAPTVLLAFLLASIVSHAPKAVRHRLLF